MAFPVGDWERGTNEEREKHTTLSLTHNLQQFEIKPTTKINRRMNFGTGFHHFYSWHG